MDVPGEDPELLVALLAPFTGGTVGTVLFGHGSRLRNQEHRSKSFSSEPRDSLDAQKDRE